MEGIPRIRLPQLPNVLEEVTVVTYEQQFKELMEVLKGSQELEKFNSRCRTKVHFVLKVACNYNNFELSADIYGDIFMFEKEMEARENVFKKGHDLIQRKYYCEWKNWSNQRFGKLKKESQNQK